MNKLRKEIPVTLILERNTNDHESRTGIGIETKDEFLELLTLLETDSGEAQIESIMQPSYIRDFLHKYIPKKPLSKGEVINLLDYLNRTEIIEAPEETVQEWLIRRGFDPSILSVLED